MPELSVIVPIYNVEKYLSRCIDSILAQTYANFELILINDGSPDRCAEIMEQYAKLDGRIVTIHQENRGVSAARNAGLKIAQGKYVGFVDPDDYIERTMYSILINSIETTDSDIACCNWCAVSENGERKIHENEGLAEQMSQEEFVKHMFDMPRTIGGSVCNKLFLREKIMTKFDEQVKICEDNLFLMEYCLNIEKAVYVNECLYNVFERKNSATRKENVAMIFGLPVRERIIELASTIRGGKMLR